MYRQEATPPFDDQGGEIIWHQVDGKWKWRPRDPAHFKHFKGITPRPPKIEISGGANLPKKSIKSLDAFKLLVLDRDRSLARVEAA